MAKVSAPTTWDFTPDPNKTLDENLADIFSMVRQNIAGNEEALPEILNGFTITLKLPVPQMDTAEVNELIEHAVREQEAMDKRELVPHAIDSSDNKMTYKLKE